MAPSHDSHGHRPSLKQPLLYALVGSVLLGAVVGIILVLRNQWGWFELRVILTTATIAIASLCGLACDLSRTPRGANHLPNAGLGLTLVAVGFILLGIWAGIEKEEYWKTAVCVAILAVATVHVCLLSIARLARRFAWVYLVACQVVYGLAILLCILIVGEIDNDRMFRAVVVISILAAAITLVIPLLHRISKQDRTALPDLTPLTSRNVAAIDEQIDRLQQQLAALQQLRTEITEQGTDAG